MKKSNWIVIIAGIAVGIAALVLQKLGNPGNMGFCIACFERDIAGAIGLHSATKVQYLRPEIAGLVLGALLAAVISKEYHAKAGSAPALRFCLGAMVMIGGLVFLGCPLRMVLRMGGGDINAFIGCAGFVVGICIGILFLRKGFTLGRNYEVKTLEGVALPVVLSILLFLSVFAPSLLHYSEEGPGSKHAPVWIAFLIAMIVGALAQRSRLCMVAGFRDTMMVKDPHILWGFVAIFVTMTVGNLILGSYKLSMIGQPIAHSASLWNVLGMIIVGWGSVLLGGCPLRQLVLAGSGNGDSAVTVFGMIVGAAVSHNFGLAGNSDSLVDGVNTVGGISATGKIAVAFILAMLVIISAIGCKKVKK